MARDEATFLQDRHMPKQRSAAHLAFISQPLSAWVALAGFLIVEVCQLNQHNLGSGLQAFNVRGPNQRHAAHGLTPTMNPKAGQGDFGVKRSIYEDSMFASAREVAKDAFWNAQTIAQRSEKIADWAVLRWKY
jgi:hypothetical protein